MVSTPNVIIVGATIDTHELAHQANRVGLFPVGDERIVHFVSFTKKTGASFKMRFSISNRLIWILSFLNFLLLRC
jgi:hypothetical protein